MDYAIIRLGGKQYRVREGETLVVDRVKAAEGESFKPDVLLGDGAVVTATVVAHERGPKIRIAKVKRRTGYRRHNGFRAATSRLEISLGGTKPKAAAKKAETPKAETSKAEAPKAAKAEAPKAEASKAEAPKAEPKAAVSEDHVKGMPHGYEDLTVAQVKDGAKTWNRPMLEAALAYENAHAQRKGAVAALESALDSKGESS